MPSIIMDTRTTAATMREQIKSDVAEFKKARGFTPSLVLVSVGEDPAIYDYIRVVTRNATQVGIRSYANILPGDISPAELREHLTILNQDKRIQAISLQTPLPAQLNLLEVSKWLDPLKDVEGLHPLNAGYVTEGRAMLAPPPALGAMKLLSLYNFNPAGRIAVVIGRNAIIGKPIAAMLTTANATVTICHRQTPYLGHFSRQADLLVVGAQQPGLVTGEMIKPGAVVIDFGINYVGQAGADGKRAVVGDVEFSAAQRIASAITPMPGGTGPLTVIALLQNVLKAANFQLDESA
jgi:methylenetetrahydrofolate dehydrogenase (NADP+)/methenyltetrahydrofolate cyclohydrolase